MLSLKEMENMKKTLLGMLMAGMMGMSAGAIEAQAEGLAVAGDIGVYNQYIWRGAPQNVNKAAVQGDVSVSADIGPGTLSASGWASNTFASPAPQFAGQDAIEFDWTLDYSGSIGDVGYTVGGIYYAYLRDSTANFVEVYAGISYDAMISPFVTAYYTVADSSVLANNLNITGDLWIDAGVSTSLGDYDLSTTVSFAVYDNDPTRTAAELSGVINDGIQVVTVAASRDFEVSGLTITPSLTAVIPVVSAALDGQHYIYQTQSDFNAVFGVNVAF